MRGFAAPATRNAGVPALDITARGEARGERASLDATINGGRTIALTVAGSVPMTATGALDLAVRGTLDAALANAQLAGSGQRVTGRLAIDGALRGTATRPDIQGAATLSGGSFSDPLNGIAFTAIEGRITGRGTDIVVERLTARAKNGGTVALTGRVSADPLRNFPADLKVTARNAELVSSDVMQMTASLDLAVTGPLATTPRLSGRIDVATIEVRVPDRLPSNAEPLRDARHVGAPAQTRARLAQLARQRAAAATRGRAPFNATLDVVLDAPGRVFVRGRGIDAELGGELRLAGTTREHARQWRLRDAPRPPLAPHPAARLHPRPRHLRRRRPGPRPRFRCGDAGNRHHRQHRHHRPGHAARVHAHLDATCPRTRCSRLLFQRAAAGLSPFQAVQLAQAVAILSGSGGADAFEATRRALGVDNLDVTTGASGPTVRLARHQRARAGRRAHRRQAGEQRHRRRHRPHAASASRRRSARTGAPPPASAPRWSGEGRGRVLVAPRDEEDARIGSS